MNKIIKSLLIPTTLVTAVAPFLVATSCANESPFEQVTLTISDSTKELIVGQTHQLKAFVNPPTLEQEIIWSSDNKDVATVDSDGKVVALKEGASIITATYALDSSVYATCTINVANPPIVTNYEIIIDNEDKTQCYTDSETIISFPFYATGKDYQEGDKLLVSIYHQETIEGDDFPTQHKILLYNEKVNVELDGPTYISFYEKNIVTHEYEYWKNEFAITITPMRESTILSTPIVFSELYFISGCKSTPEMFTYAQSYADNYKIQGINADDPHWNYCYEMHIPAFYNGKRVNEIVYSAFQKPSITLQHVSVLTFDDGGVPGPQLMYIGRSAFEGWDNLKCPIKIPPSVVSLDPFAFRSCKNITSVEFLKTNNGRSSLDVIGSEVFKDCLSITGTIRIPYSVSSIGENVFFGCKQIKNLEFDSTVPEGAWTGLNIGNNAFQNMVGLNNIIRIPAYVKTIGVSCFRDDSNINGIEFEMDEKGETQLNSIGMLAFAHLTKIVDIKIPASVQTIGTQAFMNCSNLSSVIFLSDADNNISLQNIDLLAFQNCSITDTSGFGGTYGFQWNSTPDKWKAVTRKQNWHDSIASHILCIDGTVCGLDET